MITACLCLLLFVAAISGVGDGNYGMAVVAVLLILAVLLLADTWRKSAKAYVNRVDYWAEGGPDGRKRSRR